MSQLFVDGFDDYTVLANIWETNTGTNNMSTVNLRYTTPPGCVGQNMQLGGTKSATKTLAVNSATIICGAAFYLQSMPGSGVSTLFSLIDAGTAQVSLVVNALGQVQFYRGLANGTAIGSITGNGVITNLVWQSLILVVTIDPSAGSVTAYLNGNPVPIINSTGLNTRSSANSFVNQFSIGVNGPGLGFGFTTWDDVFVWNSAGASQNAWPGNDVRVLTKMPTKLGNYTNWTANGAATNWQCNNSVPPDITKFVSNNTPGTKDSYGLTLTGLAVAPFSVAVRQSIYKDDGNTHTAQALMRSASVDEVGTAFNVNSSPTFVDTVFPLDPSGAAWTAVTADTPEIGVVETS